MLNSMTAFARSETTIDTMTVLVEIRSYNSRYLDIALHMMQAHQCLEDRIKRLIAERLGRGRIEVTLKTVGSAGHQPGFEVNDEKAASYYQALVALKEKLNLTDDISTSMLAGVRGIIEPVESSVDPESWWPVIRDGITGAVDDLIVMRKKEGRFIADDLTGRLNTLKAIMSEIEKASADLFSYYQKRLSDRIVALTDGCVEIDPDRIAQESALTADKSDVSEEISRMTSHIIQFQTIMASVDGAGRKLNFLIQECNRELNTIGSKTQKAMVSHMVVDAKSELEKIREIIQNVE